MVTNVSGIQSVNSSTTEENRTWEITGIGGLMMWREEAKWLSIFTAILKTLTAEMYPSVPQHDLMIRAGSEGNDVCFHHQTLKAALIKVSSLLFRNALIFTPPLSTPRLFFFRFASEDLLVLHLRNSPLITGESSRGPRRREFWEAAARIKVLDFIFHSLKFELRCTQWLQSVFFCFVCFSQPRLEVISALGWAVLLCRGVKECRFMSSYLAPVLYLPVLAILQPVADLVFGLKQEVFESRRGLPADTQLVF